jgi:glutamyl-tRNA reductase
MPVIVVGLNHQTAPIELREQLALAGCKLDAALEELNGRLPLNGNGASSALREGVILSTCNRLEIYATSNDAAAGWAAVETFLTDLHGISRDVLAPHLYRKAGEEAALHLMHVAAGLDSMVLGEPQILGQVTSAFEHARAAGATGATLSHLFAHAAHAGKRARTDTDISRYTMSVSHAAALLLERKIGSLAEANVLLVGAGEMAEMAARALEGQDAAHVTCINRTYSSAEALARRLGGRAMNWYFLPEALAWADGVLAATGAPHTVIDAGDVGSALPLRDGRPLTLVDIAVPRDIEEAVGELPGVSLYDIDDLQATVDDNLAQRRAAIPDVEAICAGEAACFMDWFRSRGAVPTIVDLRQKAAELAEAEIERALNRLDDLSERDEQVISTMAHRIVNKLLHEPTVRLREHAANGNGVDYASTVRDLFALEETHPDPGPADGQPEPQSEVLPIRD